MTGDVAIVDGVASVERAAEGGTLTHRFTDVAVKRGGRWVIEHVRAYGLIGETEDD